MKKLLKLLLINIPLLVLFSLLIQFLSRAGCAMYGGTCSGPLLTIWGTVQFSISAAFFLSPLLYVEAFITAYLIKNGKVAGELAEWQKTKKVLAYVALALVLFFVAGFLWSLITGMMN